MESETAVYFTATETCQLFLSPSFLLVSSSQKSWIISTVAFFSSVQTLAISPSNMDTLAEFLPVRLQSSLGFLTSSFFFVSATLGKHLSQTKNKKSCSPLLCPGGSVLFAVAALTQLFLSRDYPAAEQCVPGEMKTPFCPPPLFIVTKAPRLTL